MRLFCINDGGDCDDMVVMVEVSVRVGMDERVSAKEGKVGSTSC